MVHWNFTFAIQFHTIFDVVISELGLHIEWKNGDYAKTAPFNLKKLLNKINELNRGDKHYILVIDELVVNNDGIDFSLLELDFPNITVLVSVNPAAYFMTKEVVIKPPSRKNVLEVQLTTKHRNSYQIAVLIVHINKFYKDKGGAQCSSPLVSRKKIRKICHCTHHFV